MIARLLGSFGSVVVALWGIDQQKEFVALGGFVLLAFLALDAYINTGDVRPMNRTKIYGKISIKTVWYAAAVIIGFRLSNPVMHELGHLFVGSFFGYEVIDVNLWTYNGDHASVWFQGIDQSSFEWFLTSVAGAAVNILLAIYATRRWNRVEQALSVKWPTLGFAAVGFILAGFVNALYLLPVRFVTGSDFENIVTYFELNDLFVAGLNPAWLVGGVFLVLVVYHVIYFVRINTTPIEVKILGTERDAD